MQDDGLPRPGMAGSIKDWMKAEADLELKDEIGMEWMDKVFDSCLTDKVFDWSG